MADLKGALMAAAEEAEKMQQEAEEKQARIEHLEELTAKQQNKIYDLESHITCIEDEVDTLRRKLKNAADCMRSAASILLED
jgi:uncharacterized coiled-coil protein SlyX